MTTQTQEFSNDLVSLKVNRKPGCIASFDIEITPKGTQEAWKKALKAVNKEVSHPGFRKGKAPDSIIESNFLKYVEKEWNEELIQMAFQNSLTLSNIFPMSKESLKAPKLKKAEKGVGAEVTLEFATYPVIPKIDPKTLHLKPVTPKLIDEDEVKDTIQGLLYNKANWITLDKEAIEEGDFVKLTIVNLDSPVLSKICENTLFEVKLGKGKMGKWLYDAILGRKVGDVLELKSEQELEDNEASFTPTNCGITINSCEKPELPTLDEVFAQKLGCKDVEDLHKRVKDDLEHQAKELAMEENRKNAVIALCDTYQFDIPENLFQQEKKGRLEEIQKNLKNASSQEKAHFEHTFSDQEFSKGVENSLRMLFFVKTLSEQFGITITEGECMKELSELYSKRDPIVQQWMTTYDKETMLDELTRRLTRKKVLDEVVRLAHI